MFFYLVILFTILPALELAILIEVGTHIGAGNTILLIILTGVTGAALARYEGFTVLQKIQDNLKRGVLPDKELTDGLMILVGGVVLLIPGFITDTLGFLLLIPFTRALIKMLVVRQFEGMIRRGQVVTFRGGHREKKDYDDIDI